MHRENICVYYLLTTSNQLVRVIEVAQLHWLRKYHIFFMLSGRKMKTSLPFLIQSSFLSYEHFPIPV